MANIEFAGFLFDALGVAVASATVDLVDRNTTTPVRATTTTDSNGFYTISHGTEGRFDIRITSGTDVLWRKYDTSGQMTELEVASLNIRNPGDTFKYDLLPAAIVADRTLTLPLLTGTATLVVTPAVEDLDMGGFDIDNAGFLILNAATAPANTEVYLVHDNTGDLTLNALSGKTIFLAIAGLNEFTFSAASLDMNNNTLLNVGAAGNDWTTDAITLAGGSADQSISQTTTGAGGDVRWRGLLPASGTGLVDIAFIQGTGNGDANNMGYELGYDASNAFLRLNSQDIDGAGAPANIWRVPDGQTTIDANTTWDENVFDDYDDLALLESALRPTAATYDFGKGVLKCGRDVLIEVGVLKRYEDDWIGYNDQRMAALIVGALFQMNERLVALEG